MSDLDLESIEDPKVVEHPSTAPPKRMVRWIAAVGLLVVLALGVSVAIQHDRPLAEQATRQNASHSQVPPMNTAPPPRYTAP